MTLTGLQRKIDFKVACILMRFSLKQFAATLKPPATSSAISLILDQRARSRRINTAIRDFIIEVKSVTDFRVEFSTDNLEALSRIRSYRFKINNHRPTPPKKRRP
jgi:hypothetical protein